MLRQILDFIEYNGYIIANILKCMFIAGSIMLLGALTATLILIGMGLT